MVELILNRGVILAVPSLKLVAPVAGEMVVCCSFLNSEIGMRLMQTWYRCLVAGLRKVYVPQVQNGFAASLLPFHGGLESLNDVIFGS